MDIKYKPKAILFDWDNTLADTWMLLKEASQEMLNQMQVEHTPEVISKIFTHRSMREILPEIFGDQWEKAAHIYQTTYRKLRQNNLSLLPLAKEVLEFLRHNTSIYVSIVSNKIGSSLREEATMLDVNHFFSKLIGSQDTHEDKPSSVPVLAALEGSDLIPGKDVWFIGDSVIDIQCAYNSNCTAILYGNVSLPCVNYKPELHVKNHREFLDILHNTLR